MEIETVHVEIKVVDMENQSRRHGNFLARTGKG